MATEIQPPPSPTSNSKPVAEGQQSISVSRKIVYFQAALLGIIATTFFVFGMMVGTLTSQSQAKQETVDCSVTGKVVWDREGRNVPDPGALVLLLPSDAKPERRMNPKSIHPDSFEPLDNDVIDTIHELGGAVVRAGTQGEFSVYVDSPARYDLVVISKNRSDGKSLTKKEMATLSSFFMPVESLREDKAAHISSIRLDSTEKRIGDIKL